jgi:hypothetical protein
MINKSIIKFFYIVIKVSNTRVLYALRFTLYALRFTLSTLSQNIKS